MRKCVLCNTRSNKRSYLSYNIGTERRYREVYVCEPCWDKYDGEVKEAIMAKKKAEKKAPEIRPCAKCGRTDFKNDHARRAHQGKCNGGDGGKPKPKPEPKPKRTPAQAGKMAKRKGSKFENDVRKILAAWWGEDAEVVGTKASAFQRSPGSGGTSPENWPLDLVTPDGFPWAVECKNREGKGGMECMERFFTGDYPVLQWFRTAEEELVKAHIKKPLLLIFTRNKYPIFAAIRRPAIGEDQLTLAADVLHVVKFPDEITIMKLDTLTALSPDDWDTVYQRYDRSSYWPR